MQRVLFFDGVCNLCSASVQWVIRHDPQARIHFAALQSAVARERLTPLGVQTDALDCVVFLEDSAVYSGSDAALRVALALGWPWSLLYPLSLIPRPVREAVYGWVARHRYRWFGQRESCMVPTPDTKRRFL